MKQTTLLALALVLLLAACGRTTPASEEPAASPGMGMGRQSGMMARHHAPIPEAYAGLSNPVAADETSLERGAELFTAHCASCHGDSGMGDGPAGAGLNPAPSPIAHTSQMMGDSYLFWRISEGGAMDPFNSTMPAWKGALDEQARWDAINYMRALGSGAVTPRQGMGGATFDPAHALVMLILLAAYRDVVAPDSLVAMTVRIVVWVVILALMIAAAKK